MEGEVRFMDSWTFPFSNRQVELKGSSVLLINVYQ